MVACVVLYIVLFFLLVCVCFYIFFFKQKTAYEMRISDWSSDVCSSDLDADRVALAVAPLLRVLVTVLKPLSLVIQLMVRATLALFGIEVRQALTAEASEEQLRGAIELHQGEAEEERPERAMPIGRASCRERVCQYV